jgi:hypothetical protein
MPDASVSYEQYKFLGFEFLTWLWFLIEKDQDRLKETDKELISLEIGNRIVLENFRNDQAETVTIKGDDAGLEEGILALRKGSVVTEISLVYSSSGSREWRFTLKGESFNIANLKSPATGQAESEDDMEGIILEKVYLYEKIVRWTDEVFSRFIKLRISKDWNQTELKLMREWIHS